jgi:hypothetical protein
LSVVKGLARQDDTGLGGYLLYFKVHTRDQSLVATDAFMPAEQVSLIEGNENILNTSKD